MCQPVHMDEDGDEVHEGGVKLEAGGGGADVVGSRHQPLHHEGTSHRVVDPGEIRNAMVGQKFVCNIIGVSPGLHVNDADEGESKDHIAKVAEDVVEVKNKLEKGNLAS